MQEYTYVYLVPKNFALLDLNTAHGGEPYVATNIHKYS